MEDRKKTLKSKLEAGRALQTELQMDRRARIINIVGLIVITILIIAIIVMVLLGYL